jgi:2-polyprenyl-3-methyl-5-hydroxy-6-metoxy-1,4-benzoquinol methylase
LESFEGIICSEVLEHIEDDDKAVKEIHRVLKKDGKLFISVPANPKLWDKSDRWASHHRRYTKECMMSLLENNGFKIKKGYYWGFPITRLYHKNIFLRKLNKPETKNNNKIRKYSKILSNIFKIDNLFNWTNKGIGLIIVAEK